jgi:O-acetyl-ADP-ribose deacetylase (regulator of RNase III)
MIKYLSGTIFNAGTSTIVNTVNCDGFMGAGLALEFKLRYPKLYEEYQKDIADNKVSIGQVNYYLVDSITIINFPTKLHFNFSSKIEWIETGLKNFVETYKNFNITSVAFPKLGTRNGGLDWREVKIIMEKYLSNLDIDVFICLDEKAEAEGIEKLMIEQLNKLVSHDANDLLKIKPNIFKLIYEKLPVKRFYQLYEVKGLGIKSYEKIFKYYYGLATNNGEKQEQISFEL